MQHLRHLQSSASVLVARSTPGQKHIFIIDGSQLLPFLSAWSCMSPASSSVVQTLWLFVLVFMAALHSRCGHYVFILWFLLSIFYLFSSPNLSCRRLDVYHTSTHSANLGCRSETCCTRLAGNAGCKKLPKMRHLHIAQLYPAISSQLRHCQSQKNLFNSNISTCTHNMLNFGPLTAEICW